MIVTVAVAFFEAQLYISLCGGSQLLAVAACNMFVVYLPTNNSLKYSCFIAFLTVLSGSQFLPWPLSRNNMKVYIFKM